MLRPTLFLSILAFLFGCASTRTSDLVQTDALETVDRAPQSALRTDDGGPVREDESLPPAAVETESAASAAEPMPPPLPAVFAQESLHSSRFTIKGGYYGATEDTLDDGYIFNVSWMRFLSKLFAVEFEAGYLDVDGDDSGVELDVWGAPIMLNGRFNVPVWILDLYGGAGVGTFYYDAEASGALSGSDDGFLWATDAFIGATINIADRIALGLEGKYYVTDDVDDVDEGLDAYAVMLTLGFSR